METDDTPSPVARLTPRQFADRFPAMWTLHENRCDLHVHGRDAFAKLEVYPFSDDECSAAIHADGAIVAGCTGPILATIGKVLAYAISKNPKVIDLTKIPRWAFKATRVAIDVYRQELEEIQTHLECSDTEPDNDDAPSPVADWMPDCDYAHPDEELIRLGKAFVDRHQGVLTEGQMVSLTGLDRVTVRDVEDLFNQAMSCLADGLALMTPEVKP